MNTIDRAYLRLTKLLALFIGLGLVFALSGCVSHNICTDPHFEIDVPGMCHAEFNREEIIHEPSRENGAGDQTAG